MLQDVGDVKLGLVERAGLEGGRQELPERKPLAVQKGRRSWAELTIWMNRLGSVIAWCADGAQCRCGLLL